MSTPRPKTELRVSGVSGCDRAARRVNLFTMDAELRLALKKLAIGVIVILGALVVLGLFFREYIDVLGQRAVDLMGYPGIFLGIAAADMFTLPIPPDAYLFAAVTANLPIWKVIVIGSIASILGGIGAYWIGHLLKDTRFVQRLTKPFRERGEAFINRAGSIAVIVAAVTPIPFSIICMLAGSTAMRLRLFLPATLFRIPRIAGYFLLYHLIW